MGFHFQEEIFPYWLSSQFKEVFFPWNEVLSTQYDEVSRETPEGDRGPPSRVPRRVRIGRYPP